MWKSVQVCLTLLTNRRSRPGTTYCLCHYQHPRKCFAISVWQLYCYHYVLWIVALFWQHRYSMFLESPVLWTWLTPNMHVNMYIIIYWGQHYYVVWNLGGCGILNEMCFVGRLCGDFSRQEHHIKQDCLYQTKINLACISASLLMQDIHQKYNNINSVRLYWFSGLSALSNTDLINVSTSLYRKFLKGLPSSHLVLVTTASIQYMISTFSCVM